MKKNILFLILLFAILASLFIGAIGYEIMQEPEDQRPAEVGVIPEESQRQDN